MMILVVDLDDDLDVDVDVDVVLQKMNVVRRSEKSG